MKAGWTTERLGDLAEFKPPKSEARKQLSETAEVTFLPMEDLGVAVKYPVPKHVRRLDEVVGNYTYFADGDLLLAKITPCFENGKLGIARGLRNGIGFGSSEFFVIRPGPSLSGEWLFYFLSQDCFRMEGARRMGGAVGQQRLPREFVEQSEIPLPPLPEQRRIVDLLDRAFEGLAVAAANAEKNLENARELFESHLSDVFTRRGEHWVETTLGECTRFIDYRGKTPVKTKSGLRLITAKNVKMGYLQRAPEEFVAPDSYAKWMTRGIPARGDVIFTTEAPLANVALLDTDERVVFAQRIIVLQPDRTRLDGAYLKYMLQSAPLQASIHAHGTGATVQGIKASLLKNIPACFPAGLSMQVSVVRLLDAMFAESQRLAQRYIQKHAELAALKRSLLHQAFNGEL